jgi:Spy/CpxP family protein refolding chaperone
MKHRTLLLASALVLIGAVALGAQEFHHYRHGNFFVRHIIRELDLSDAQVASIKQILVEERPALQALAEKHREQRDQLRALGTFDEAKVRTYAQNNTETYVQFVVEREKIRSRIYAVLTPAQQQKVDKLMNQMHGHMQDHLSHLGEEL